METFYSSFSKDKVPQNMNQFVTKAGFVNTLASDEAVEFSKGAGQFIEHYSDLYTKLSQNNEKIYIKQKELASLQESSSIHLRNLAALFKSHLKNDIASNLYTRLAAFNEEMSTQSLKIGATMNEYLNKEIKYSATIEPEGFQQYLQLVEKTKEMRDSAQKELKAKRDACFKKGYDRNMWQIDSSSFDENRV